MDWKLSMNFWGLVTKQAIYKQYAYFKYNKVYEFITEWLKNRSYKHLSDKINAKYSTKYTLEKILLETERDIT